MNFVRYNPQTGAIVDYGYMEVQYIEAEIAAGKPTLFASNIYDFFSHKVNLETKELEPIPPTGLAEGKTDAFAFSV